jgi:hypothetical protein
VERDSYKFPSIILRHWESIEDLLLQLYDKSFSNYQHPSGLIDISLGDKIKMLVDIVYDIQKAEERIKIYDYGC